MQPIRRPAFLRIVSMGESSPAAVPVVGPSKPRLWGGLGPGLITGAADDDPSGIATYAQAGAQFGFGLGWTLVLTYPLMVVIQAISARIGRTTGLGIAGNIRRHYPNWVLQSIVMALFAANVLNIGADLGGMAASFRLLVPVPVWDCVVLFGAVCVAGQVFLSHTRYVSVLKWLTLSLFAYFGTVCVVRIPWSDFLIGLVRTQMSLQRDFWQMVVAILGTTISPYLFFWQAAQEVDRTPRSRRPRSARVSVRELPAPTDPPLWRSRSRRYPARAKSPPEPAPCVFWYTQQNCRAGTRSPQAHATVLPR
jgi:NRAMP (natural resistance-associated macrophage protein)-like metal ion transporter